MHYNKIQYIIHEDKGGLSRVEANFLFDGITEGYWAESVYWNPSAGRNIILDIEFINKCNISIYRHKDYPTTHNADLNISKYDKNTDSFIDVTDNIVQIKIPETQGNVLYPYIDSIDSGRYQFKIINGNGSRLDMEWVITGNPQYYGLYMEGKIYDITESGLLMVDDCSEIQNRNISLLQPYLNKYDKVIVIYRT